MAQDDFTAPQAPEYDAAVGDAPQEQPAQVETRVDPSVDTAPVNDPSDAPDPTFNVTLAPNSDLEAPVFVSIPTLFTDVAPLPHPDDIKDAEGNFLPGYDESTPTLVETENGWQRPDDAEQPQARVPVDEHGRLELSDKPVEVPAIIARVLEGTPFVKIAAVRS